MLYYFLKRIIFGISEQSMLYTPNNEVFTKLRLFFTALSSFDLIEIISLDESSITLQFKTADLNFSLLRQHLEALLDCELMIISDIANIYSFSIVG